MSPENGEVLLCRKCGSSKLSLDLVASPTAKVSCSACGWVGQRQDLLLVPGTGKGAQLESAKAARLMFVQQVGVAFTKQFVHWCVDTGMVDPKSSTFEKDVGEYVRAGVNGAWYAILEKRLELETKSNGDAE